MREWLWGLLLALGISVAAQAKLGNEVGNGGNAVVCRDRSNLIETVRLLDYYEATLLLELKIDVGSDETPLDKVRFVLKRLSRYDATRAKEYLDKAEHFFENTRFIDDVILPDTKDYGYVPLEKQCVIEQLAIQRKPLVPEAKRYTISRDLWKRLSPDHQAGLILHEIVYGDAIAKGHKDSVFARYLTSLISATKLETLSQADYDQRVADIGMSEDPLIHTPVWVANPVVLSGAIVGHTYYASLIPYVKNIDDGPLTFAMVSGPAWLNVHADGLVAGVPRLADVGKNLFRVRVTNTSGYSSEGTVQIQVDKSGTPSTPTWKQDPIDLGIQLEDQAWTFDLKTLVNNPWQDKLAFSASALPSWMVLSNDGVLSGTPSRPDIGSYQFRVAVRTLSGESGAIAGAQGKVVKVVHPIKWSSATISLPDAIEGKHYSKTLMGYVLNPEAARLSFRILSGAAWLSIGETTGKIEGIPGKQNIGGQRVRVEVSAVVDGMEYRDHAELVFTVLHKNHPPVWLQDPIALEACRGVPFRLPLSELGRYATDFDGDVLSFGLQKYPSWLAVDSAAATFVGVSQEVGDFSMIGAASDGQSLSTVTIIIRVIACD